MCKRTTCGTEILCKCGRQYKYCRDKGHNKEWCNSCRSNSRRFKRKQKLVALAGGKCKRCGYNRSVKVLEFHHRNPAEKKFAISGSHTRAWAEILKEMQKCDLLCANCHREVEEESSVRIPLGLYPIERVMVA